MSSHLLSPEQVAFRRAALIRNLRQKYPELANRSDQDLYLAYGDWFLSEDTSNEDDFKDYLPAESIP